MRSYNIALLVVVGLASASCGGPNAVQCENDSNCNLSGGGRCIVGASTGMWCAYPDPICPGGYRYSDQSVGGGLAGECVPDGDHVDAGVDAPADARPDANPAGPIVATYQHAEVVLGQPNFDSWADNAGSPGSPPTAKSLYAPDGACSDGGVLYIVDPGNSRVVGWNPAPTASYTDAQRLLGKSSFTDGAAATGNTATNLRGTRCSAAGGKLVVADVQSRRVLIWNSVTTPGQAVDVVLGGTTTSYNGGATTQSLLKDPYAVWTNGTKIAVADAGNHRIMIWNTWPTVSGQAADLVLGQPDFVTGAPLTPPTASSMIAPAGVWSDGTKLYVGDQYNHRVLVWTTWPTVNGQAADLVIGQPNPTSNSFGKSATTMSNPQGVLVIGNALFVADTGNDRVLVFTPLPSSSGAAASYVLGQPDLNSGGNNPVATNVSLDEPVQMTSVGDRLYVVDRRHNRVMGFQLNLP